MKNTILKKWFPTDSRNKFYSTVAVGFQNDSEWALPVWRGWLGVVPQTKSLQFNSQSGHMTGSQVQSLVEAHTESLQFMFLFLSFSLPFPLSKI